MIEQFTKDVIEGLSSTPKFLSSKYFYDEIGDDLFVQIMKMPEYYLTRSEFEIFHEQTNGLIESFGIQKETYFELIELGAGDGVKTKELLKELVKQNYQFDYFPIDISQHALDQLDESLSTEIEHLNVKPKQGDYFEVLSSFKNNENKKVILFLGSNIGNLRDDLAHQFIYQLGANLKENDILLLGVDLIKSREIVLPAYNDPAGITARFNLNLLHRINKELDGNFNIDQFEHKPDFTEEKGVAESFLVSSVDQTVHIGIANKTFDFKKGEKIHTEISRKYNDEIIEGILTNTSFTREARFTDAKSYFADYILKRN